MGNIIFHDVIQGSEDWHALRAPLWTGSRAIRLLQGKSLPDDGNFAGNKHTKRGHILEVIAIKEYERQEKTEVARPGFVTNTLYPAGGYSPDGIDGDALLEVKALNGERHEALVNGDIPLMYLVQIYFGMVICGLKKARLLAFNPEYEQQLTIIDIKYDKVITANIRKKLRAAAT
jgi:hypothetical protein